MPRPIDTETTTLASKSVTRPGVLIEFGGILTGLRYSSLGNIEHQGNTFVEAPITLRSITEQAGGAINAQIDLPWWNMVDDFADIVTSGLHNTPVSLWFFWADTDHNSIPVLVLSGEINGIPTLKKKLVINIRAAGISRNMFPDIKIGPPIFNHITIAGSIVRWGYEIFTLR